MSVVTFGKRERLKFVAGEALKQHQMATGPAVYAVTYKQDAATRPKSHTVLYFGETPDISQHGESIDRDLREWWADNGGNSSELFFFVHLMPGSSQYERANVQNRLVSEYDPRGNK